MKCVRPSPRMGVSIKNDCQYYRYQWNMNCMPVIQKSINTLSNNAMKHKYMCDPYHEIILDQCNKLLDIDFEQKNVLKEEIAELLYALVVITRQHMDFVIRITKI